VLERVVSVQAHHWVYSEERRTEVLGLV